MINRICSLCNEYASDTWTLVLSDEKNNKIEFSGHKTCIDKLEDQFKSIKGREKMSLEKILKQLNLKR